MEREVSSFTPAQMEVIGDAGAIAEEVLSDRFALTSGHWRRWPYEVRRRCELRPGEDPGDSFAHLVRYGKEVGEKERGGDCLQFYRVCLNDPAILRATGGGGAERLLPFMVYVMLHELIHIVRFGRYLYHPLREEGRGREEARVEALTRELLAPVRLPGLSGVIAYFAGRGELPWREVGSGPAPEREICSGDQNFRRCSHAHIRV